MWSNVQNVSVYKLFNYQCGYMEHRVPNGQFVNLFINSCQNSKLFYVVMLYLTQVYK